MDRQYLRTPMALLIASLFIAIVFLLIFYTKTSAVSNQQTSNDLFATATALNQTAEALNQTAEALNQTADALYETASASEDETATALAETADALYETADALDQTAEALVETADALVETAQATPGTPTRTITSTPPTRTATRTTTSTTSTAVAGTATPTRTRTPTPTLDGQRGGTTPTPTLPIRSTPSQPTAPIPMPTPEPITADALTCIPGTPIVISGKGPPRAAYLLYFGQRPVAGGSVDAYGHFTAILVVGMERNGTYPVTVRVRGTSQVLREISCAVPQVTPTPLPHQRPTR